MSNDALTWAWRARIPDGPKFVLVALADHASDHAGEDWTCFPSVERLIERTSKSRSTVERALKWLDENGWISRRRRRRGDGTLGIYDFTLHREKRSEATPIERRTGPGHTSDCRVDHASNEAPTTRQNGAEPHVNLTQQEPSPEPSDEPSQGARAQGEALGEGDPRSDDGAVAETVLAAALAAWPESGRHATKAGLVRQEWPAQRALAGDDETLLACMRAFAADPMVKRRSHGAGGLQNWLRSEGWRSYLGVVGQAAEASVAVPGGRFVGPPEVRAVVADHYGEAGAGSIIDTARWREEGRVLTPRTGWAFEQMRRLDWAALGVTLIDPRGQA